MQNFSLSFRDVSSVCIFLKEVSQSSSLDLSGYSFIEPMFIAVLEALGIKSATFNPNVAGYAARLLQEGRLSETLVPITKIKIGDSVDKVVNEIIKRLTGMEENSEEIGYILSEIVENSLYHGQSHATVYSQVYLGSNEIEIGVIDTGLGFLKTLSRVNSKIRTHEEALREAVKKGVSGSVAQIYSSAAKHQGMGLYIVSEIVKDCKGVMYIISGNAIYDVSNNYSHECEFNWNGSIVYIRLNREMFKKFVGDYGISLYISMKLSEEQSEDIF